MEKVLLIATVIMSLITMLCVILITIVVTKESKQKILINKILKVTLVVLAVATIIGVAIGVSTIDKTSKSDEGTTESSASALESAGFNEVTLKEYLELVKSSDKSIVLIARPTCSYCEKFAPILEEATKDLKLTVNYIDIDKLSEDELNDLNNSVDYLKDGSWGTPTTLIVQNGTSIAENQGYVELGTIKSFFTDNGLGE